MWIMPVCDWYPGCCYPVSLGPFTQSCMLGHFCKVGCFCPQETEFPAKSSFQTWGLLSHLTRSPEGGWFQSWLIQWPDQVKTLEFFGRFPHGHMVAAVVPSITSTFGNNQKQEEMNPWLVFLLMDKNFLRRLLLAKVVSHALWQGNGIAWLA